MARRSHQTNRDKSAFLTRQLDVFRHFRTIIDVHVKRLGVSALGGSEELFSVLPSGDGYHNTLLRPEAFECIPRREDGLGRFLWHPGVSTTGYLTEGSGWRATLMLAMAGVGL